MIKIRDLTFEYFDRDEEGNLTDMINAIRGINFDAADGEFIAIAGRNGSGKSTFARLLNRLLAADEGEVNIAGLDAGNPDNAMEIRKKVGMVFQDPEDELIGSIVAEDVAFGAENIGLPEAELPGIVREAIAAVCFKDDADTTAARRIVELSGGEKQKTAIACVLAMHPECIVFDESTSMLDPTSRRELLTLIKYLNREKGITVILVTHNMEELLLADRIYVFDKGRIVMNKRRNAAFADSDLLEKYGLECPKILRISKRLREQRVIRTDEIFSTDEMVERLMKEHPEKFELGLQLDEPREIRNPIHPGNAILLNHVSFSYEKPPKHENTILKDVSVAIEKGQFIAVTGESGAGKSTLLQLMSGLLAPDSGEVYIDGLPIKELKRHKVGYLFQNPGHQLFEKNVYEDVVFGPRNTGISEIEAEKRAYEAIKLVGLSEDVYDLPVNKLSGGERRRVALAGILAMEPDYLILDEPTAGLDPEGARGLMRIIEALNKEAGITIIMVCHDAELISKYAGTLISLQNGNISICSDVAQGYYNMFIDRLADPKKCFDGLPVIMELLIKLRCKGLMVDCVTCSMEEGIRRIVNALS